MNRNSMLDRFATRLRSPKTLRRTHWQPHFEPLEVRKMLSANDLILSMVDASSQPAVKRFNDITYQSVPGGVALGDHGLGFATGLAVAPDGSFYVSSGASASVLHYSNSGSYIGVLGASDVTPSGMVTPGSLQFGPNGHLYVSDIGANAIYQFDTSSLTQQFQPNDTLPLGFTPGGFAIKPDGTLIVGELIAGTVTEMSLKLPTAQGANPSSVLELPNGDLLVADTSLADTYDHHQILKIDHTTHAVSVFIDLDHPIGGSPLFLPPQPTALGFAQDGNLLVGLSPDHLGNGAIEKFNITTGAFISDVITGIGTPSSFAFTATSGGDLLVSTVDDTGGQSVLRYDATTLALIGGVATGDHGLAYATGLAVAADGSYWVSSAATSSVLHYSSTDTYLGTLGSSDVMASPLASPGALKFNPVNSHLYVADLGGNGIYEYDTSSLTQQYIATGTQTLSGTPGGFNFTSTGDLLAGVLTGGPVVQYHRLVTSAAGLHVGPILRLASGDLLIADFILADLEPGHGRIMKYDATTHVTSQFIGLTVPVDPSGTSPQPTALALDADGNLLVGVSTSHTGNSVIEKFNITSGAYLGTIISGIDSPSSIALIPSVNSSVANRQLFYKGSSRYDTAGQPWAPAAFSHDNAIAKDKSAYLPNGTGGTFSTTATFGNVSSYDRGINGVMIDLAGAHGTITSADFTFKVGNNNTPSLWTTAPAVATVLTRTGAGVGGSDRIELIWNDNDIKGIGGAGKWLEVIFKGNDATGGNNTNTGLVTSDIFFFGSSVGDTGLADTTAAVVDNANDELHVRNNPKNLLNNIPITNIDDFNRDGQVTTTDELLARNNTNNNLSATRFLKITSPPAAPEVVPAASGDAGLGSGLASAAATGSVKAAPATVAHQGPATVELSPIRAAHHFGHLGETARSLALLAKADHLADTLGLDDELLDALLAGIGSNKRT